MKRFAWVILAFLAIFSTAACSATGRGTAELFDIPRLDNITIDGDAADWKDGGFRINMLTHRMVKVKLVDDLDARARLAYDQRGLLFLVTVRDDVACEKADHWNGDSVELFISDATVSPQAWQYHVVITPGMDPAYPEPQVTVVDQRSEELKKVAVVPEYGRKALVEDGKTVGYVLEVRLPWEQLGMVPEKGREVKFQFFVNDLDAADRMPFKLTWFPRENMQRHPDGMYTLRLSDKPSTAIDVVARAVQEKFRRTVVTLLGTAEAAGTMVAAEMRVDGKPVKVEGVLIKKNGRSEGRLVLPLPTEEGKGEEVIVSVAGKPLASKLATVVTLKDLNETRWRAFMEQRLHFAAVFMTPEFPKIDFAQPVWVEDMIGPYEIATTFYDADYREVTTAAKPGRYGAVVTITNEQGFSTRRFLTLYRTEKEFPYWQSEIAMTMALRKEFGIDPAVLKEQQKTVREALEWPVWDLMREQGLGGDLFAGLAETKPSDPQATACNNIWARDRAWWLPLKRKLYGSDQQFTTPLQNPAKFDGPPATVLRAGTLAEAKMKPGTTEKLDQLLKQWAADSDEGFNVCVARNGVIVLHAAYGTRGGKPFTAETKSWLVTITQVFSGTAMMMAVDQGFISLDDPIDKYLPPFKGRMTKVPTIRQLYTHTAGMREFRDMEIDLAEILSACAPYYKVGQNHDYNGTSLTLGSSILELVTGETLSTYYQKRLLEPLGMKNIDVVSSSHDAVGTAYDLAIFAQMLLNKGSYGNLRFMRPETFTQQLPHLLPQTLSPTTPIEWGIGLEYVNKEKTAIGHSSHSTFWFYPSQNLLVTMARKEAGKNFNKYHSQFIQLIQDCLE